MKINQEVSIKLDKISKDNRIINNANTRFAGLVQKQEQKLQTDSLNKLLGAIGTAGGRLLRTRNFKDLSKYKSLVRRFLKEAVDYGMDLEQSQSWNQYGQTRVLKTVKLIDEKLIQLAEDVMNQEKDALTILEQIGEIKGLLINLYT